MESEPLFRLAFLLIFGSSIVISGYYRKKARESSETIPRRAEGGLALLLRAGMALLLLASFLLYIFVPQAMSWSQVDLPLWVRIAAAILGFACLPFLWWVFTSIGKNISETVLTKQGHQLVTKGPYRWIRHPLYAGALLELFLLGILAGNWFMLALWALGAFVFRFVVIPKEEANLTRVFGDEYKEYMGRTGALLPRLGRKE